MEDIPNEVHEHDNLVGDIADLVHSVARRIRRTANEDLGPLGVTPSQARALRTLARCERPVRMSKLADLLGIARRSATSVVDELVERALVARRADVGDRRAVVVEVSAEGHALLDTLGGRRRLAASRLAGRLSQGQLETLRTLLRRLDDA